MQYYIPLFRRKEKWNRNAVVRTISEHNIPVWFALQITAKVRCEKQIWGIYCKILCMCNMRMNKLCKTGRFQKKKFRQFCCHRPCGGEDWNCKSISQQRICYRHRPCGGEDWNQYSTSSGIYPVRSPPLWRWGLKLCQTLSLQNLWESPPLWRWGLKSSY